MSSCSTESHPFSSAVSLSSFSLLTFLPSLFSFHPFPFHHSQPIFFSSFRPPFTIPPVSPFPLSVHCHPFSLHHLVFHPSPSNLFPFYPYPALISPFAIYIPSLPLLSFTLLIALPSFPRPPFSPSTHSHSIRPLPLCYPSILFPLFLSSFPF